MVDFIAHVDIAAFPCDQFRNRQHRQTVAARQICVRLNGCPHLAARQPAFLRGWRGKFWTLFGKLVIQQ